MTQWPYGFEGRIQQRDLGSYRYTVIYLPADLAEKLEVERHRRLRARGVVGAAAFFGAWQPAQGRWYLLVSQRLLRRSGYRVGDLALVRFRLEDAAAVDLPWELEEALAKNKKARAAWKARTPGWRRGRAYMISTGKRPETRERRVAELLAELSSASTPRRSGRTS